MTTLRVHEAELYYETRGTGPYLLISQSGEGDAGRSVDLVDRLTDEYTVITYDRRGLSRSTGAAASVRRHADDVHRLLAHLTDRPVIMLGQSLGASIGITPGGTATQMIDTWEEASPGIVEHINAASPARSPRWPRGCSATGPRW